MSYIQDDDASQIRKLKDEQEKLQALFLDSQFSVQLENIDSGQNILPSANPTARTGKAGSTGSGHTIQDEGIALTERLNLNFVGPNVTVTDDAPNNASLVTIEGVSTPAGAAENDHLEWNNSTMLWESKQSLTFGSTGPFADSGFIRTANNQIVLSSRNSGDSGNFEIKLNGANVLDLTESDNNPIGFQMRAQNAVNPDAAFTIVQTSDTGGIGGITNIDTNNSAIVNFSIEGSGYLSLDSVDTAVKVTQDLWMVNKNIILDDTDQDSGIGSTADDTIQIFTNGIIRVAFTNSLAIIGLDTIIQNTTSVALLTLFRDDPTPANDDEFAHIDFQGSVAASSGGASTGNAVYGRIFTEYENVVAGRESASMAFVLAFDNGATSSFLPFMAINTANDRRIRMNEDVEIIKDIILQDGLDTSKLFFDGGGDTYFTGSASSGRINVINDNTNTMFFGTDRFELTSDRNLVINTGFLRMAERADPTAGSNEGMFYVKDVGGISKPFYIGDGQTAVDLTAGSGGGITFPITPTIDDRSDTWTGTQDIDLSQTDAHITKFILDQNLTLTFSNPPSSGTQIEFEVELTQDSTGGFTVTWPASVVNAPTISTNADTKSIVVLRTNDGGTTYYAVISINGSPSSGNFATKALDNLVSPVLNTFIDFNLKAPTNFPGFTNAVGQELTVDGNGVTWDMPTGDTYKHRINGVNIAEITNIGLAMAGQISMGENYITMDDISTPANPGIGARRIFVDTATGELSVRTTGGTTVSLESSGGEVNPDLISQAEAEAGTATTERIFSALRVKQAIDALGGGGSGNQISQGDSSVTVTDVGAGAVVTKVDNIQKMNISGTSINFDDNVVLGLFGTDDITFNGKLASDIGVKTDASFDIGDSTHRLVNIYASAFKLTNSIKLSLSTGGFTGDIQTGDTYIFNVNSVSKFQVSGTTIDLKANVILGVTSGDTITFNGRVSSHIEPNSDNTRDLGSSSLEFRDLYIDGVADIDRLENNGGAIAVGDDLKFDFGDYVDMNESQSGVGAAGSSTALPSQPEGYVVVKIAGTKRVIPFYKQS